MKHIVFSIAVLCAVAAQAYDYDKYTWQPTTGGEFSTFDDTKGWKKTAGGSREKHSYYLETAQSAALTLSNDWTLAGWLDVKTASNVFDFGTSTLTVANGFNVENGGGLLFKSGTINSQSAIYVNETKNAMVAESLTIDNATLQTVSLYHRTTTENDYDSVVMITNHAVLSASSSFFTEGGSTNAHVFIVDHSSLKAQDWGTGRSWGGYADGGWGGTVTFADHSTGTFTGNANVGASVPHTWLEILSGSEVTNNALYVGNTTASSNNLVKVDNATLTINHAEYLYLGGKTTYSCDNTLLVTNCGVLNFKGASVGYLGSGNRLIVTGPGSTATAVYSDKPLYIGRNSGDVCGTNAVIVTDHAQLTVNNLFYVGYSTAGINPDGGLENRLEVTDGATANLTSGVRVYPGSSIQTKGATISFDCLPKLYHDTRCAFVDSAVTLCKNENADLGGVGAECSNTEVCFTNSTVTATRFRLGSTNIVLRLYDSTMTCNGALHSSASGQKVSAGSTIVFGGAAPQLTVTQYEWCPNAKLRFEIPKAGYPTERPIMAATDTNGFKITADAGTRTVEVVIHPKCPSGTYTLLKGKNATEGKITTTLDYNPDKTKAEIVKKKIGDDEELQVKVERIMKGLAVIVK